MKLTKDLSLMLHAIHSLFYWRVLQKKPYSSLVLKLFTKNPWNHKTRFYFAEQKNEGRKPDKNSSLRGLIVFVQKARLKLPFKNYISGYSPQGGFTRNAVRIDEGVCKVPYSMAKNLCLDSSICTLKTAKILQMHTCKGYFKADLLPPLIVSILVAWHD